MGEGPASDAVVDIDNTKRETCLRLGATALLWVMEHTLNRIAKNLTDTAFDDYLDGKPQLHRMFNLRHPRPALGPST